MAIYERSNESKYTEKEVWASRERKYNKKVDRESGGESREIKYWDKYNKKVQRENSERKV